MTAGLPTIDSVLRNIHRGPFSRYLRILADRQRQSLLSVTELRAPFGADAVREIDREIAR